MATITSSMTAEQMIDLINATPTAQLGELEDAYPMNRVLCLASGTLSYANDPRRAVRAQLLDTAAQELPMLDTPEETAAHRAYWTALAERLHLYGPIARA